MIFSLFTASLVAWHSSLFQMHQLFSGDGTCKLTLLLQAVPDAKRKRANTKKTANGSSAAPKAAAGNKENNTASRKVSVSLQQARTALHL